MSVQKKSLIGKAAETKATTKTAKQPAIGESKGLTANAMRNLRLRAPKYVSAHKATKRAVQ